MSSIQEYNFLATAGIEPQTQRFPGEVVSTVLLQGIVNRYSKYRS